MARKIRIIRTSSRPSNAPRPVPLSAILEGTVQRRFWGKVQKGAPDDCWLYLGAPESSGYGVVSLRLGHRNYKKVKAHVFALMTATQQVNNQMVLHSLRCTTKLCVNPSHLRWGNNAENSWDERDLGKVPGQKLTWDDVDQIREMLEEGIYTQAQIGTIFGVNQKTISVIKTQEQWNPATRRIAA